MADCHHSNDDQPGYHTDSSYRAAIQRYLGWLGVACLIASYHAGSATIFVWIAVAYVLTRQGGCAKPKPPKAPTPKRNQKTKRRC